MRCGLFSLNTRKPVPLISTSISVTIGAAIGHVESELTYLNDGAQPVETVFSFPLDEQSAVYKFQAEIDGKIIIAECQEKEQARETYKDAMDKGHTAFLLEERDESADIFTCRLGNLPPQSQAKLNICYVTELDSEPEGWLVYTLPTVLRPRYSPQTTDPSRTPQGFTFGCLSQGPSVYVSTSPYTIKFRADIHSRDKIREVKTNSDWMTVEYSDYNTRAQVEFTGRSQIDTDQDLTIHIAYENVNQPQAIVERGTSGGTGILSKDVLALSFYPDLDKEATSVGEYIFVIDRSGSMGGDRINNAKQTLLLLLKSLPVGCYFNVVSFGSNYSMLFDRQSEPYTASSLKLAVQLQQTMNSDMGGTEILPPLQEIYLKSTITGHPRQIFLLTDGGVGNTQDVIKLVGQNANNSRMFAVGIGEGVSTSLVKGVARAGRGKAVFVKGQDRLQEKVMSLLKCAMQPVATDVSVEWELPSRVGVTNIPQTPPPIYNEEKIVLYALLSGSEDLVTFDGRLKLRGKVQDRDFEYCLDFTESLPQNTAEGPLPIHRLSVKALIKELEDRELKAENESKENKDKITKQVVTVSLSANIVSRHTAFVGVDKESKVKVPEFNEPLFFPQHSFIGGMPRQMAFAASNNMAQPGGMGLFGSKSSTPAYQQKQFISSGFSFGGPVPPPPPTSSSFGFGSTMGNSQFSFGSSPAPPPRPSSSFGFGSTKGNSLFSFGGSPTPPPPPSSSGVFGSTKGNSPFSFGGSPAPPPSSSGVFGSTKGNSPFSFGGSPAPPPSSSGVFGSTKGNSPFSFDGSPATPPAPSSSGVFGSTKGNSPFSFGGSPAPAPSSSGVFGSTKGNSPFSFGGSPAPPPSSSGGFGSKKGNSTFSFGSSPAPPPPSSSVGFGSTKGNSQFSFGGSPAPPPPPSFRGFGEKSSAPPSNFPTMGSQPHTSTFSFGQSSDTQTRQISDPFSGQTNFIGGSFGSQIQTENIFNSANQKQSIPTTEESFFGDHGDDMMQMVSLQTFVGSWVMSEELCKILGIDQATLMTNASTENMEVWATVLALAWLNRKYSQRKGEWEMIESKAQRWLLQSMKEDKLSELLENAKRLV